MSDKTTEPPQAAPAVGAQVDRGVRPLARMLVWCGPAHRPAPPPAARTYAEFPESAALPANPEALWRNDGPLYDQAAMDAAARSVKEHRERLRTAVRTAIAVLERHGDEHGLCADLRRSLGA